METKSLNKLIGIPFRLNKKDFFGCDCRGIVCLYYEYVKGIIPPFTDGKRVFFRDKRKDVERMKNILDTLGIQVKFNELQESDVVLLKTTSSIGAMGVCINNKYVLHMDRKIGSCLTRIRYLKDLFLYGYRIDYEKLS